MSTSTSSTYRRSTVGIAYDALNATIWWPHGSSTIRQALVHQLGLRAGERVLELGCGTGQVTELLVRAGGQVTAVDSSGPMLERARRRASSAQYIQSDFLSLDLELGYDVIVGAFVLHELDTGDRLGLLEALAAATPDRCRLAILDWSLPRGALRRAAWRAFVRVLEPPAAAEVLEGALDLELAQASWHVLDRTPVANGRATVLCCRKARRPD